MLIHVSLHPIFIERSVATNCPATTEPTGYDSQKYKCAEGQIKVNARRMGQKLTWP
jgi:hypothetical protein